MDEATKKEIYTTYELPKAIEALRAGWLATFQGAATVSGLLAGIEAGFLVFFKDQTNFGGPDPACQCNAPNWIQTTAQKCILILTYLSLILSLGVTVTSYVLTAEFSILPSRAARDRLQNNFQAEIIQGSNWDILHYHGLRDWTFYVWLYWLFALIGAVLCSVLSIAIFVGTQEDIDIKAAVLVFVGLFAPPVLSILLVVKNE